MLSKKSRQTKFPVIYILVVLDVMHTPDTSFHPTLSLLHPPTSSAEKSPLSSQVMQYGILMLEIKTGSSVTCPAP